MGASAPFYNLGEWSSTEQGEREIGTISPAHCCKAVLGRISDRDAPQRPSTRNATRVKKRGRNYTFCPILMKNRGRNTTFSSFLLKYRGQNTTFFSFLLKYRGRSYKIFQRPEKGGSKWRSIYSNLHRVSTSPGHIRHAAENTSPGFAYQDEECMLQIFWIAA